MEVQPKSNKKRKKIILAVIATILLPFVVYASSIGLRIYKLYNTIHQPIEEEAEFEPIDPIDLIEEDDFYIDEDDIPKDHVEAYQFIDDHYYNRARSPKNPDHLNILLIGVDARRIGGAGRSDSIMVVQYNKRTKKTGILSIPRDTYVKIPERGYDKINHSFAFGRTRLLKETVEGYLDIHIDHYAQVDMQSFVKIVDKLGGVTINVPAAMVHTNGSVLFAKGNHHMDGNTILAYTSARMLRSGGGNDFGRIRRQQQVVTAILSTIKKDFSMMKTLEMMEEISPYIRTDITPGVVMGNWTAFNSLNVSDIELHTLSGSGFMHNRIYYLRVPIQEAREIIAGLTE